MAAASCRQDLGTPLLPGVRRGLGSVAMSSRTCSGRTRPRTKRVETCDGSSRPSERFRTRDALDSDAHRLRWAIDTDVHAFQQALSEQRRATAAELYEGVLLDGLALPGSPEFEGWLGLERQACHERWRLSSLDWATEFEAVDRFRDAGEILARLYRADAFDEDVLRRYLRALHADGQRTKALAEFDAFTQSLQAEFGTEPEQATVEIGDAIRRGQPPVFTPPEAAVTNADPAPGRSTISRSSRRRSSVVIRTERS
jgi:DNA-binding SARP family transcriptional activator